jgi:hypothetical protein
MLSKKLSLSIAAALVLSAAGIARAETNPLPAGKKHPNVHSAIDDQVYASESGNPDSVDYGNRVTFRHSPTNDEINAAEVGNPESPDYKNRPDPSGDLK